MATVRCWALHGNINNAISYVLDIENDGKKTEKKYYECTSGNAYSAAYDWKLKGENIEDDKSAIVGFHFQQSFEPGSISADEAYEISKLWIDSILKGEYDYVLTLHTDKKHIHSHIIVNPINKNTGKHLNIFYKKDLPKYKLISDQICKENGLKILEDPGNYGKSYYEWMMENRGDSAKEIVQKALDNLVERVSTYEELKQYLTAIGFEVEDDLNKENDDNFIFTGDIKLVKDIDEDTNIMNVRLPYTRNYIHVDQTNTTWVKENKTFKVNYKNNDPVKIYDENGNYLRTIQAKELELNWEKKNTPKRKGLRIKIPGYKKFIRCNRISRNENGIGYSLDDILERIENNSRLKCDPDILKVINSSFKSMHQEKEKFYEEAEIKSKWKNSPFYNMSKKERYVHYRTKEIQNRINQIQSNVDLYNDMQNINVLVSHLNTLQKEYKKLNDDIRKQELILENIELQQIEGKLDITPTEIDDFIKENITPLYQSKKY